jgi:hypothetical protein
VYLAVKSQLNTSFGYLMCIFGGMAWDDSSVMHARTRSQRGGRFSLEQIMHIWVTQLRPQVRPRDGRDRSSSIYYIYTGSLCTYISCGWGTQAPCMMAIEERNTMMHACLPSRSLYNGFSSSFLYCHAQLCSFI